MERKNQKETRLLPGDYLRKIKYDSLDNTEKSIKKQDGFFSFPENEKGDQSQNKLDFLVFYFDDKKQYKTIKDFFEIKTTHRTVHPILNSERLFNLVKKEIENE